MSSFHCYYFKKVFVCFKSFCFHLKFYHLCVKNFTCGEKDCLRAFPSSKSFRKHALTHTVKIKCDVNDSQIQNDCIQQKLSSPVKDSLKQLNLSTKISNDQGECNHSENVNKNFNECDLKEFTLKLKEYIQDLIIKFYSNSFIPRNIIQIILEDVFGLILENILPLFMNFVDHQSKNNSDSTKIKQLITEAFESTFQLFNTEYKRFKYFENNSLYIPPLDMFIDYKINSVFNKNKKVTTFESTKVNDKIVP